MVNRNCNPRSVANRSLMRLITAALVGLFTLGCRSYHNLSETVCNDTDCIDSIMAEVDAGAPPKELPEIPDAPLTLKHPEEFDAATYRDMTLQEAIAIALSNAEVLRDLSATVLRAPELVASGETLGLVETDPQFGIEGALSAFDAQFYAFGKFQNNDRRFNNRFFGGGSTAFQQDVHDYVLQMSKRTATGTQFAVRSVTDYDSNNATGNLTKTAWQTQLQACLLYTSDAADDRYKV